MCVWFELKIKTKSITDFGLVRAETRVFPQRSSFKTVKTSKLIFYLCWLHKPIQKGFSDYLLEWNNIFYASVSSDFLAALTTPLRDSFNGRPLSANWSKVSIQSLNAHQWVCCYEIYIDIFFNADIKNIKCIISWQEVLIRAERSSWLIVCGKLDHFTCYTTTLWQMWGKCICIHWAEDN